MGLLALCFGRTLGATIVDIASGNNDFDILTRALKRTGFDDTLSSAGAFTVLAPTDRVRCCSLETVVLKHLLTQESQAKRSDDNRIYSSKNFHVFWP